MGRTLLCVLLVGKYYLLLSVSVWTGVQGEVVGFLHILSVKCKEWSKWDVGRI